MGMKSRKGAGIVGAEERKRMEAVKSSAPRCRIDGCESAASATSADGRGCYKHRNTTAGQTEPPVPCSWPGCTNAPIKGKASAHGRCKYHPVTKFVVDQAA